MALEVNITAEETATARVNRMPQDVRQVVLHVFDRVQLDVAVPTRQIPKLGAQDKDIS